MEHIDLGLRSDGALGRVLSGARNAGATETQCLRPIVTTRGSGHDEYQPTTDRDRPVVMLGRT